MNDAKPTMCNVIFSAGNYPAFRANYGLYAGNALWIDDVELIYSSRIDKLTIDGVEWKDFNPDTDAVQTYRLDKKDTRSAFSFAAFRGIGALTNIKNQTVAFNGRQLGNKEMVVVPGTVNGKPWTIIVAAEDGSSTHTYRIKIVR